LSALTKIAVVLLVVASLLLSAGVVVFVNKVEHFKNTADEATAMYNKEVLVRKDATQQVAALNAALLSQTELANKAAETLKGEVATKEAAIVDLKNQLAKLETDKKVIEVALADMTRTQQGIQGLLAAAQAQVTELRASLDKTVNERDHVNVALTDALAKVDALERARRNLEEQKAGLRASLEDLEARMKKAGFTRETLPARVAEGTPVLEGVVKDVFSAGSKPWASITLGSKDNVTKGMKFNVINNNEFLGYLTIQTTEPNEATGVLDGPAVEKVHTGDQVKTQLQ